MDPKKAYEQEIQRLAAPGNLSAKLAEIDKEKPLKRIFIMGCGRSGTWLLTAVMSTFDDLWVVPEELNVEAFGIIRTTQATLVLKRIFQSFARVELIPEQIGILYIIRHPFDVLTSRNRSTNAPYHISPDRWLGEMLALQYLIDTKRPHTKIIRYEDLVSGPDTIQAEIGEFFHLKPSVPVEEFLTTFKPSQGAITAMHGLRKIDKNSLDRYKREPDSIQRLIEIRPRLGRLLDWVSEEFSYDISL